MALTSQGTRFTSQRDSNIGLNDFFLQATWSPRELIHSIIVKDFSNNTITMLTFETMLNSTNVTLVEKRHRPFGSCYTFNLSDQIKKPGIGSIIFN